MQVVARTEQCVGSGQCVMAAPAVFDQDDDGIVAVLDSQPTDLEPVRQAVHLCPARALSLQAL